LRIVSAASAFPKNYYPQPVLVEAFHKHWGTQLERPEMLGWLQERVGVDGRYLAYPVETYENLLSVANLTSSGLFGDGAAAVIIAGVVLEKFMRERRPTPGAWSVLAAMGPEFCSELVLLRW
jgi:predicted naringenin-chalcone synthase